MNGSGYISFPVRMLQERLWRARGTQLPGLPAALAGAARSHRLAEPYRFQDPVAKPPPARYTNSSPGRAMKSFDPKLGSAGSDPAHKPVGTADPGEGEGEPHRWPLRSRAAIAVGGSAALWALIVLALR